MRRSGFTAAFLFEAMNAVNAFEKNKSIKAGLRQGFQDGSSKIAKRWPHGYLYTDTHEAIISDEMFMAVRREKLTRTQNPKKAVAMRLAF